MATPVAPVAPVAAGRAVVAGLLGARVLAGVCGGRKTLHDAIAGEHSTIDREIPAHHEGPHGGVLLSQAVRFVCKICLVLAPIDQNQAGVATRVTVTFVCRVSPPSSSA